jgi:hypothetical protein
VVLRGVPAPPSHRGALIPERVVVSDEQDEAERVSEVDTPEFRRCGKRGVRIPVLRARWNRAYRWPCEVTRERMFAHAAGLGSSRWI